MGTGGDGADTINISTASVILSGKFKSLDRVLAIAILRVILPLLLVLLLSSSHCCAQISSTLILPPLLLLLLLIYCFSPLSSLLPLCTSSPLYPNLCLHRGLPAQLFLYFNFLHNPSPAHLFFYSTFLPQQLHADAK